MQKYIICLKIYAIKITHTSLQDWRDYDTLYTHHNYKIGGSIMLNTIIDGYLTSRPDSNCCWFAHNWISRRDFMTLADKITDSLRSSGFCAGQRLAVLMPNSPVMLALMLSTWRLGGTFCPLNEKTGEISLIKTLGLLKPFSVILSDNVSENLESALKNAEWHCTRLNPAEFTGDEKFSGTLQPSDEQDKTYAVIFSTSGTTGDPKAVPLTHDNLLSNINACLEHVPDLQPNDSLLNVLPNFHAFGFTICCVLPFVLDATQVLLPSFMPPSNTIKTIEETKPTVLLLVPTMVGFAASMLERLNKKLTGIKLLIAGGDRYNPKIDARVTEVFGTELIEGYGITECSPVLAVNPTPASRKLGTVGPALPGFELQLRSESGEILYTEEREVPHEVRGDIGGYEQPYLASPNLGEEHKDGAYPKEGVLWTRGPSVTPGYYHADELNHERFIDGWFNTGDYVQIDEDGYIKILDRVTDIIIVGT